MNDTSSGFQAGGSEPQPVVYPATSDLSHRSPWRLTVIAVVLTLVFGGIGGGWLALRLQDEPIITGIERIPATATPATTHPAPAVDAVIPATAPPAPPAASLSLQDAGAVSVRLAMLEDRLARITLAAENASGNAARAEALLLAFAARRSIERGFPLGPMEAQLRVRFGDTQPNAVNSILSASTNPVTNEELLQQLDDLRPVLMSNAASGWLTRLRGSLSSLIIVRSADTPSSLPQRRFERARRAIAEGRIDQAMIEVEALPGHTDPLVERWLTEARRMNDARRALDLIETAAILEPGSNRGSDRTAESPSAGPLRP